MVTTSKYNGAKIAWTETGMGGKTIVMLHGFMETMNMWKPLLPILRTKFHVICIDLPGHGQSDPVGENVSMEQMAEMVQEVLVEAGVKHCLLCGHSMGGYLSLAFAKKYPEMTKAVTLFHSHAAADSAEVRMNRFKAIQEVKQNQTAFVDGFFSSLFAPANAPEFTEEIASMDKCARKMDAVAIAGALDAMRKREDMLPFIETCDQPILFIVGKQDSRKDYKELMEHVALPRVSELLLLDECGHMGFLEKTDISVRAIFAFAARWL